MTHIPRPRLLSTGRLPPDLEALLATDFDVLALPPPTERAGFLAGEAATAVGLVTTSRSGADAALIDALPALRVISNLGVGYETLDVEAARRRGIVVGYTPDVLTDCVADLAMALLLDVVRGVSAGDRFVRRGAWLREPVPLATRVSGKRLGVLGLGRIGQAIARRAAGFDLAVRYTSRRLVSGVAWAHEPSLRALAEWADFLVVAAAGGPGTQHLVDAEVLQALGPQGYLVNIARGSVVDEAALVDALVQRRLAGAGLDVFEREPQVPEALWGLDTVVLTPHVGSATRDTRQAMSQRVVDNLRAFFAEGRVVSAVP